MHTCVSCVRADLRAAAANIARERALYTQKLQELASPLTQLFLAHSQAFLSLAPYWPQHALAAKAAATCLADRLQLLPQCEQRRTWTFHGAPLMFNEQAGGVPELTVVSVCFVLCSGTAPRAWSGVVAGGPWHLCSAHGWATRRYVGIHNRAAAAEQHFLTVEASTWLWWA